MTDKATETEKELMKANRGRLVGISKRQGAEAPRDYLFSVVFAIAIVVIAVLAIAAVKWHWSH